MHLVANDYYEGGWGDEPVKAPITAPAPAAPLRPHFPSLASAMARVGASLAPLTNPRLAHAELGSASLALAMAKVGGSLAAYRSPSLASIGGALPSSALSALRSASLGARLFDSGSLAALRSASLGARSAALANIGGSLAHLATGRLGK